CHSSSSRPTSRSAHSASGAGCWVSPSRSAGPTRGPAGRPQRRPRSSEFTPADVARVTASRCRTSRSLMSPRRCSRWRRWAGASSIPARSGRSAGTRKATRSAWLTAARRQTTPPAPSP
ncbi:MAG: hypothetical protein AVDCRST_MAG69-205, partial [uncultured Solirubrobacteraceae bacterium]